MLSPEGRIRIQSLLKVNNKPFSLNIISHLTSIFSLITLYPQTTSKSMGYELACISLPSSQINKSYFIVCWWRNITMPITQSNNEWMNYLPDFTSPFGMLFYSFFVFILITIHNSIKRRTVQQYVDKNLRESMKRTVIENRKKKDQQARQMLDGLKKIQ